MKSLVFIDYVFMFSPDDTWAHLSQFEADLANYFAAYGLEVSVVKMMEGATTKKVLYIDKISTMPTPQNPPNQVPVQKEGEKSMKQVRADLTRKQGYDGKFQK